MATVSRILTTTEARSIQLALNEHGAHLEVDGHFGELSHLALIRFQHDNGLPETGNPDLVTTSALGIPAITTPAPAPPPKLTPNPVVQAIGLFALKALLNRITKGQFPMLTTMDKAWVAGVVSFICNYIVNHFWHITIDDGTQGVIVNVLATLVIPAVAVWLVPNKPKTT